jgi:hypothetical protein
LQADPIIQAPGNAQSHNRYSYVMNNPLSLTDPSGFSWWTKHRRQVIGIVAGILTAGAATWAMGAYALANGATMFAAATGGLTKVGLITAAAAGGFASGGINGGNIQSALRGAFMAAVTAGVVDFAAGAFPSGPGIENISQATQEYMVAYGNGAVQSGVPGMDVGVGVSDANGGLGEFYRTGLPSSTDCGVGCGELRRSAELAITGAKDRGLANAFVDWWQRGVAGSHNGISQGIFMGIAAAAGPLRGLSAAGNVARGAQATVLGENMVQRVIPYANATGARTLPFGTTADKWAKMTPQQRYRMNDGALRTRIREGDSFVYIGIDIARPATIREGFDLTASELLRLQVMGVPYTTISPANIMNAIGRY